MKKIFSLFAALLLCTAFSFASKVYFLNTADWTTVNIYCWGGSGASMTWPGVAMTSEDRQIEGHDLYSFEGDYAKCIFNNKVDGTGVQTGDLDWTADNYYDYSSSSWAPLPTEGPAPEAPATVYFVNAKGWGTPHAVFGTTDIVMTNTGNFVDGFKLYSAATPDGATTVKFTNGASVSSDAFSFASLDGKTYFNYGDNTWYATSEEIVMHWYLKHGFSNTSEWTWREVVRTAPDAQTFSLRAIYCGNGCNWNGAPNDKYNTWKSDPTLEGGVAAGDSAVFTLNPYSKTITITKIEPVGGGEPTPTNYYLIGGGEAFGNWNLSGALLMENATITLTLPAGVYEFKVLPTNTSWDGELNASKLNAECCSANVRGTNNIHVSMTAGDLTVSVVEGRICVTGTFLASDFASVYTVVGDPNLVGSNWDLNDANNAMTLTGDVYTLTLSNKTLAAGDYEWKIVGDHSWNVQFPASGNYYLNIAEAGTYNVVFTLNLAADPAGSVVANLVTGTALENVASESEIVKIMREGQVYILRDGILYNALGQMVK